MANDLDRASFELGNLVRVGLKLSELLHVKLIAFLQQVYFECFMQLDGNIRNVNLQGLFQLEVHYVIGHIRDVLLLQAVHTVALPEQDVPPDQFH